MIPLFYFFYILYRQASVKLQGITRMWSLRSSVDDKFDTFLVVSFDEETRIFAMNTNDDLVEAKIDGFHSTTKTFFAKVPSIINLCRY